jgi:hypothetical protein
MDEYLRRSHRVNRAAEGQAIATAGLLAKVHEMILQRLERGIDSTVQLNALIFDISEEISRVYGMEIRPEVQKDIQKMASLETEWNYETLTAITTATIVKSSESAVFERAMKTPYQGKTFDDWFRDLGATEIDKISRSLRASYLEGKGSVEAARDLRGIMNISENHVKTLARSSLLHTSAIANDDMFAQNYDVIAGKKWSSILDIRTTPHICGVRDQKKYTNDNQPVNHSLEWGDGPGMIHFNCRSTAIPIIDGIDQTTDRPAVSAGENYERGDNVTRTGKVRKPNKPARDKGIYDIERRTTRTRYEGWLRSQPVDFIADALGSMEKAQAFKGGANLTDVTGAILGIPISINNL